MLGVADPHSQHRAVPQLLQQRGLGWVGAVEVDRGDERGPGGDRPGGPRVVAEWKPSGAASALRPIARTRVARAVDAAVGDQLGAIRSGHRHRPPGRVDRVLRLHRKDLQRRQRRTGAVRVDEFGHPRRQSVDGPPMRARPPVQAARHQARGGARAEPARPQGLRVPQRGIGGGHQCRRRTDLRTRFGGTPRHRDARAEDRTDAAARGMCQVFGVDQRPVGKQYAELVAAQARRDRLIEAAVDSRSTAATPRSTASPAGCPSRSLMSLNPSRSPISNVGSCSCQSISANRSSSARRLAKSVGDPGRRVARPR